jgi:tetratricopeptide (TPR) repeat protein
VESVAWIAERKDVLSTFFGLLSLSCYVRYVADSTYHMTGNAAAMSGAPRHLSRFYWAALAFFALGLMSKPMLVTLPFVMLLLDFWPLGRCTTTPGHSPEINFRKLGSLFLEKWPFFILVPVSCIITYFAQKNAGAVATNQHGFYMGNALVSYLRYIGRMFWPVDLSVIYPLATIAAWQVAGAVFFLLAVSLLCVKARHKRPYLLMGWLWYLGTLVPAIGFLQVGPQSSADRYTYMPLTGLFIICVWGATDVMAGWKFRRPAAAGAATVVLSACLALTVHQLQFWKNGMTLFEHTLAVTANNAFGEDEYAGALIVAGKGKEAFAHDEAAMRLEPGSAIIQNDYAAALVEVGRVQEALSHYAEAARMAPNNALIQNNYGVALARAGMTNDAIAHYEEALHIQPDYVDAYNNLGALFASEGQLDEAATALSHALEIDPHNADIHLNLGIALLRLGRIPDAAQEFSNAVNLDPGSSQAQYQFGLCLAGMHQPAAALGHLAEASRLQPDWAEPLNAGAWILATDGDAQIRNGMEAVKAAENAASLTKWQQPVILNTLAASYAEAGRFEEATNTAAKAISLAQQSGQERLAQQIQSLLALYQQHQAFHHP